MKATGIVRRLDQLGRITLPIELRRTLGIKEGDPVEIFTEQDAIVLKKYNGKQHCHKCEGTENLHEFEGIYICDSCLIEALESEG